VLIATDDSQATTLSDPELLIEEARQRQRQRARRRATVLVAVGVLAMLGFGIDQLTRGGGSVQAKQSMPATIAADPKPMVIYEKVETVKIVPHLPIERHTVEAWSATNATSTWRGRVTIAGGHSAEIGAGPGHGKVLGAEQITYLYLASTNTIYRTGANLVAMGPPISALPQEPLFRRLIAQPGVHLNGTRALDGHTVYVVRVHPASPVGAPTETLYVDKHTYVPMMSVTTTTDLRVVTRTLAWKALPATKGNLRLTSLAGAHPRANRLPAPPRIKELFGRAFFLSGESA
jgi:hypothetical protein